MGLNALSGIGGFGLIALGVVLFVAGLVGLNALSGIGGFGRPCRHGRGGGDGGSLNALSGIGGFGRSNHCRCRGKHYLRCLNALSGIGGFGLS